MDDQNVKTRIIEAALEEFNDKGIHFTMDQLAKRLGISKKTIYNVFRDKEDLLQEGVKHCFQMIKTSENQVYGNNQIDVVEKLKRILIVLPERFKSVDFRKIYSVKDTYPKVYDKIAENIDTGWEATLLLLEQGIEEKKIRPISIPVFKAMFEAGIKEFISSRELIESDISYEEALEDMIDILMEGICQ